MKNKYLQIRFFKAALRLEERTGCTVFVRRAAHIDELSADIHVDGWKKYESPDFVIDGNYDEKRQFIRALRKLENAAPRVLELRIQKLEKQRELLAEEDAEKQARRVAL